MATNKTTTTTATISTSNDNDDEIDEIFESMYGSCKAENLRSDGTLVARIVEWKLANGQHANIFIPTLVDEDEEKLDDGEEDGEVDEENQRFKFDLDEEKKKSCVKFTFDGHKDSLFGIDCTPSKTLRNGKRGPALVATGGGDDVAILWNAETGSLIARLEGHTDSVVSIAFNSTGEYVATGGYDSCVKIWQARGPKTGSLVATLEGPGQEIEWIKWHPKGDVILAGSADGSTWMWLAPDQMFMQLFTGHEDRVNCGSFTANGKLVVTGSNDATLRVWDPKTGKTIHKFTGHLFHQDPVVSLGIHHKRPLVVSGSTDGTVCVVHAKKGKILSNFHHGKAVQAALKRKNKDGSGKGETEDEDEVLEFGIVETVAFSNTNEWIASGDIAQNGSLGSVCVWDLKSQRLRFSSTIDSGITKLTWHPTQPLLYVCSLDGIIREYDARSGTMTKRWYGHRNSILDMSILQNDDDTYILTASDDWFAMSFSLREGGEKLCE